MEKALVLVLPVLAIVLIGYAAVRVGWLSKTVADGVSQFTLSVAVPLLVFHTLATSKLPKNLGNVWELLGAYYAGALAVFILAIVVARHVFHNAAAEQGAYGTYATNSNVVLLGLPAAIIVLGSKWTTLMILVAGHGLIMAVMATVVIALFRRQTGNLPGDLRKDLIAQAKQPIVIALVAGLVMNQLGWSLPGPVKAVSAQLAGAAVPCALFAVGAVLARFRIGGITQPAAALVALKLVVFPAIVWILATEVMSMPASWVWMAVMLAAMPTAFDLQLKGRGGDAEGSIAALSTMLGAASLTALTYIIVA